MAEDFFNEGRMTKTLAVFDFDGTLTTRDTLLVFIRYVVGTVRFVMGFMLYSPMILLMFAGLYPNWKCKERVFRHFFKGMAYEDFKARGITFSREIQKIRRQQTHDRLAWHLAEGHKVYIISASIEEWVKPYCEELGNVTVLATQVKPDLTGFASSNCYGREKVERLLAAEPDIREHRQEYYIYAYGDSNGDREMLEFADSGVLVTEGSM